MKANQDTKQHLLQTGFSLFCDKGFTALGLAEILATAGVPKGSFYHYFKSKEEFALQVLEYYAQLYRSQLEALFADSTLSYEEKVLRYCASWQAREVKGHGCLIVKLSAEIADISPVIAARIKQMVTYINNSLTVLLETAQQDRLLSAVIKAEDLAQHIYYLLLGAAVVYRLERDEQASSLDLATKQVAMLLASYKLAQSK